MKKTKIFAFYFFPIMYVILGGIISVGIGVGIILDYYVYHDFILMKSEWGLLALCLLTLALGLFLIFRDKVLVTNDCCVEKLYNKTVKEISRDKIKRIIVTRTPFNLRGGDVRRKSIIIDDGTFQEADLPKNCFHHCPRDVTWILIDYSVKRLQKIKAVFSEAPIEWKDN